jgi:hypothetical protein
MCEALSSIPATLKKKKERRKCKKEKMWKTGMARLHLEQ